MDLGTNHAHHHHHNQRPRVVDDLARLRSELNEVAGVPSQRAEGGGARAKASEGECGRRRPWAPWRGVVPTILPPGAPRPQSLVPMVVGILLAILAVKAVASTVGAAPIARSRPPRVEDVDDDPLFQPL